MRTELLTGWWIDTGKLTPLLEANRLLLEKIDHRIDGTVDATSTIDGRVHHRGSAQRSSTRRFAGRSRSAPAPAWSTASSGRSARSARGCEIVNSEIEHSVVMDRSQVLDIPRLEDSLIGREAVVRRTHVRPRALRLMVGDHCQIDVE